MPLDNDDIKQLIQILQKGLTDETESTKIPPKRTKRTSKKTSDTTSKPKPLNKFEQMAEFNTCKEDTLIDKKIVKPAPSARLREFEPINVRCRICGKTERVPPNLVDSIERYKCNKCSTGAG
jgi:hypothetical protein